MKYLGLAIDESRVVGVRAYKEEGLIVVDGAYELERVSSIEDDMSRFFDRFGLYQEEVGVVLKKGNRSKVLPVPSLERYDVLNTLYWDGDLPKDPDDEEVMDFLCYGDLATPLAYAVMLRRADVKEMIDGITCSDGNLKVVAHWPSPLVHSRQIPHSWVMGLEENGQLELFFWSKLACLGRVVVPVVDDGDDYCVMVEEAIEGLLEEVRHYDETIHIDGLGLWGVSEFIEDRLYTKYGYIEPASLHVVGEGKELFKPENILWENALGLAMRGIEKAEAH